MGERGYSGEVKLTPKDLGKQFHKAQKMVGEEAEHALLPASVEEKHILEMPIDQIEYLFARRYEIYQKLLESQDSSSNRSGMSKQELERMRKWLSALNSLDEYIQNHKDGSEQVLRERQVGVFEDLRDFLEQGGTEGYVKLPTGVGKTVLFTELIEALDLRTLVVVPTKLLIKQTKEAIEEFASDLDIGRIYASAKEYGRQVTITTYDSLVSQIATGKIKPEDFDCVVLDEAHVSLSDKRVEAVKSFKQAVKIGFTATPEYSPNKKVGNLLGHEIHRMDIKEAVEEGLLSPFSALIAKTEVDLSKVKIKENTDEYDEKELEKAVNVASRNQAAVDLYKKRFNGELAVAYCVGVKHASTVAAAFRRSGVPAAHISGEMSEKIQQALLEKFHTGEIKVLCNADLLIAGFNEPQASVCLNLRPTRSRVVAEQRGGRVVRIDKKNPKKHASIIDFVDKGIKLKRPPVLFADVAGGAEFYPKRKGKGRIEGKKEGSRFKNPPILDIPGLEVITDVEEIMKVVRANQENEELGKKQTEFLSLVDLQKELQQLGIKSSTHYHQERKKHKGWPGNPFVYYGESWMGWEKFLEKEDKFLSFDKLQAAVKKAGIKSSSDYHERYKGYTGWPSEPHVQYSEWPGWAVFITGEKKAFIPFKQFKEEVRRAGIKTSDQYSKEYKKHPGWPSAPQGSYANDGWTNWEGLLGDRILKLDIFQKQVRDAKIKDSTDYKNKYKEYVGWPSTPQVYYGNEWPGWDAVVGKERKTFEQLRKEVVQAKIEGSKHYSDEYKKHPGWPSAPAYVYRDKWPGWPVFLRKI